MRSKLLIAFSIGAFLFAGISTQAATCAGVYVGGTGICYPNIPKAHTVLLGNDSGAFSTTSPSTSGYVLTSNGVSADPTFQAIPSGGSGNVATSTSETAGYLSYWTSTGATPATLGKVATSSTGTANDIVAYNSSGGDTFTSDVTISGVNKRLLLNNDSSAQLYWDGSEAIFSTVSLAAPVRIEGNAIQLRTGGSVYAVLDTSSLSSSNKTFTFPNKTGTFALTSDIPSAGLSTTTPLSTGNLLVYSTTGAGAAYGVATSTLSASSPLTGSFTQIGSGGSLGIQVANTSQGGYLSSTDWNTFNGKQYSFSTSTLSATSPLTGSFVQVGSGGSLGCQTASGSQAGCLSSTDWTTFNNKGSGTVTSVAAGVGLNGGTITSSGTLSLKSYIATSSAETKGQLAYWTSTSATPATLGKVATSSVTYGLGFTKGGTFGALVGGSSPTLSIATSSLYSGTTGQFPYFSGTNTITATSSLYLKTNGNVGIGTTSPYKLLSIGGSVVVGASTAGGTLGDLYLPKLGAASGKFLAVDATGKVIATTTPTGGGTSYWATGSNNIWNTNSKNVGIGTTTPKALLTLMASSTLPTEKMFSITDSTGASVFSVATSSSASLTVGTMTGLLMAHSGLFYATATSSPVSLDISGNAGTATKLATARNIAGVAFDGTTNISLNNNAITNGAGYITAITGGTCTNQFARSISTAGAVTCATVGASDVSLANLTATNGTLTFSGTYTGATARTIGLNLGNANTWTALQQFSNASSTQLSAASQKFYVDSTGKITGYDITYSLSGTISPMRFLAVKLATTTTWTGTTSEPYTADFQAPFTGTVKKLACYTDTGTLTVRLDAAGTDVYLKGASTTNNTNTVSLSITKGDKMYINAGNPASSPTWIACTLGATQS